MKNLKLICLVTLLVIAFVSVGAANAQTNEATITAALSKYSISPGESITVSVTVQNTVSTQFQIIRIGLHGDWMDQDAFQGPNLQNEGTLPTLSSSPYTASFIITIPTDASMGSHTYYVGVDAQDNSGHYYSWNSAEGTLQVAQGSATVNPTQSGGSDGSDNGAGSNDFLFYIAIVAIVVMVVLVLLVLLTLRRRNRSKPEAQYTQYPATPQQPQQPESQPETESQPEQQPEEKPKQKPASDENFDI